MWKVTPASMKLWSYKFIGMRLFSEKVGPGFHRIQLPRTKNRYMSIPICSLSVPAIPRFFQNRATCHEYVRSLGDDGRVHWAALHGVLLQVNEVLLLRHSNRSEKIRWALELAGEEYKEVTWGCVLIANYLCLAIA